MAPEKREAQIGGMNERAASERRAEQEALAAEATLRRVSTATAYDYDAQCWVTGPAAERLIREQARQTLACIDRPSYRRMMGYTDAEAVRIKTRAMELSGENES